MHVDALETRKEKKVEIQKFEFNFQGREKTHIKF